jgi:hypothetical protein
MNRIIPLLAAAALLGACADQTVAPPVSSIQPTTAVRGLGNPPPPVARDGFAEFDAFLGDNSENTCSAHDSFSFSYEYLVNKPGNNAFLHIRVDGRGLDVAIHQTNKKVDAKGTIVGPGFSFDIGNVVGGAIINEEQHVPSNVSLQLTGKLTTETGVCTVNATLNAQLIPTEVIG